MGVSAGKTWLLVDDIHGKIERCNTGVGKAIGYAGTQEPGVGWNIHPESLLGRIVDNLMSEIGPQERLATHQGEDPASGRV